MHQLKAACRRLPSTTVQDEEREVARSPILILMSTVLSLNRRWYNHALPARRYFEENVYSDMFPKTLGRFRDFANRAGLDRSDWSALARTLWGMNEWDKARILTELVDYLLDWSAVHAPEVEELVALQQWSGSVTKDQFLGRIKGLGPRAFEQLMWYIEGKEAIKLDRHVLGFMNEVIQRRLSEDEMLGALRRVAGYLGNPRHSLMRVSGTICRRVSEEAGSEGQHRLHCATPNTWMNGDEGHAIDPAAGKL